MFLWPRLVNFHCKQKLRQWFTEQRSTAPPSPLSILLFHVYAAVITPVTMLEENIKTHLKRNSLCEMNLSEIGNGGGGGSGKGLKLVTLLHLVPRTRMVELYLHHPTRLRGKDRVTLLLPQNPECILQWAFRFHIRWDVILLTLWSYIIGLVIWNLFNNCQ
jgi:hypothetical protein